MKIERLYSDYQEEERLYSTGNDELDELMERAFCEGYEYAQREFGRVGDWLKGNTARDNERIKKITRILNNRYVNNHQVDYKDKKAIEEIVGKHIKTAKRLNMAGKAAVIALPTAAAVGTGVAIKKHHDKKKKEQE